MHLGGLSLSAIRDQIGDSGLQFEAEQACGTGQFTPLARLDFTAAVEGEPVADGEKRDVAFDPVLHSAPDVALWPEWLRELREAAYAGSREGRVLVIVGVVGEILIVRRLIGEILIVRRLVGEIVIVRRLPPGFNLRRR